MKNILTLIGIILAVWIIPITPNTTPAAEKPQIDKLRVTYVKLPLNVPTIIIKHFGMLEKEFAKDHIGIEWMEITEGGKQTQALAAGSIDIASVVSSTAAITARANGMALKIVSVFSRAPKAFALVTLDPAIKTVADLKGKKVAGPKGSLLNQTLFTALLNSGLKINDVGYVHMPVPKAFAALVAGSIDAALIAGPTVIRAEAQGARIIATGEGLVKGLIVTAVAEPFINEHADVVKHYLKVQDQALAFMKDNPDQTYAIVAQETGLSGDDVKHMYPWYDFTPTIDASDMADLTATQQFLLESGMISNPTDIQALVHEM